MRQEEICDREWAQISIRRQEIKLTKIPSPRVVSFNAITFGAFVTTPRHITAPHVF